MRLISACTHCMLLGLWLSACHSPASSPTSSPTPIQGSLPKETAVALALQFGAQSQPEIDATNANPHLRTATLLPYSQALQLAKAEPVPTDDLNQQVWLISLSGTWKVGMPAPNSTPSEYDTSLYGTSLVILDARTGQLLRTVVMP